jgi:hypothetical protein
MIKVILIHIIINKLHLDLKKLLSTIIKLVSKNIL